MIIPEIILGASLLSLGRRLFILFVAAIGFFTGANLVTAFPQLIPESLAFYIGVGVGLLGALLAIFLHRLAVYFAGFLAGSYLLMSLFNIGGIDFGILNWLIFLIGGVVGAVLIRYLFDWTLIIASSIIGASLIVKNIPLNQPFPALVFIALLITGIVIQDTIRRRE